MREERAGETSRGEQERARESKREQERLRVRSILNVLQGSDPIRVTVRVRYRFLRNVSSGNRTQKRVGFWLNVRVSIRVRVTVRLRILVNASHDGG